MGIFQRLYELHGRLDREREQFEVYAGDAILSWDTQSGPNHHPLVLQAMRLEFEPEIPRFSVSIGERPAEIYTALLRSIDEVDGGVLAPTNDEFQKGEYGPFDGSEIDGFLGALAHRLHVEGVYGDAESMPRGVPRIYRQRLLFLRRRTQGFTAALEAIASDLPGREDLPVSLRSIVGVYDHSMQNDSDSPSQSSTALRANEEQDLLFTKPANEEQARIARQLESHDAVMVQGPPGTGKTHTIANLIGHLLAKGKSVLVTSHTAKALERVREVIVEDLQPLAVSVVGGDTTERTQLEHSVREITNRLASDSTSVLKKQARRFEHRRHGLLDKLKQRREEQFKAIHAEYLDIVVEGGGVEPSEAAREVTSGRGQHDWIPGPVDGADLTLTTSEIEQLYETNGKIGTDHERELARPLPPAKDLPSPSEFGGLVNEESELEASDRATGRKAWCAFPSQSARNSIKQLARECGEVANGLRDLEGWELTVLEAGMRGRGFRQVWEDLLRHIGEVEALADDAAPLIAEYGPRLPPSNSLDQTSAKLREICDHLEAGGSLSKWVLLTHPSWKAFLEACDVGMGNIREPAAVESLRALAQLQLDRERLRSRWRRTVESAGMLAASELGPEPEIRGASFAPSIRRLLDWHDSTWKQLDKRARETGLDIKKLHEASGPQIAEFAELKRLMEAAQTHLPAAIGAATRQLKLDRIRMKLDQVDQELARFDCGARPGDTVRSLRQAVRKRNHARYTTAHKRLEDLRARLPAFERRNSLLTRLAKVAPAWSDAIKQRQGPHGAAGPPGDPKIAWRWRVLNEELDRRAAVDPSKIQSEIERLDGELQRVTARLVSNLAWAAQRESTSPKQKRSLIGWVQAMKKVGKGTGKDAPRLLAAARKYMAQSRSAVPVWIMPLSRVVETFDFKTTRFDVLIIDEASQSDVLALTALYITDQVVIVGDDEQVTPAAVGQNVGQVTNLIAQFLSDIPNGELFDGGSSIYDLGSSSFGRTVQLREHFRCAPEIIEFSNRLSYQGTIQPLRDVSDVARRPAVLAERVDGARNDRHENEEEAEFIVSAILAACDLEEYRDATFGVISMLGRQDSQARLIDSMLRKWMEPADLEQHRILVGSPAHFQGDERDVMFLSLVDSPKEGPLALRSNALFQKRYNVAASRAKDQMWVVHSINPEVDLKSEDLRAKLIRHAMHPAAIAERIADQEDLTESPFERDVLRDLVHAGYKIEAQHQVGALRIDLVAYGANQRRAAIECDGDRYHTLDDLDADLSRQALLERLGWRFVRIRGSEYYRDPEATIARVREHLSELGVETTAGVDADKPESSDLVDRVRARAAEIRRSWREDSQSLGASGSIQQDRRRGGIKVATNGKSPPRGLGPKQKPRWPSIPRSQSGASWHDVENLAAVRRGGEDTDSSASSRVADKASPTASKRAPVVDSVKDDPAVPDSKALTGPIDAEETTSERSMETDGQMRFESLVPPVTKSSQQSQLLRERAALKAAYDTLYAQSGRPGRVNLASLTTERRALSRAWRAGGRSSSWTPMRKGAARKAIKAALAEIDAELAT